ncbi:hypothetical protein C809_03079 [Lachnospiraceae bacterium MD335]|nr:hypothetical protein C809_03079 [Lachnospiraceae bacterium MD335]
MCYKDEVQKKNAEKLQRKFEEDNAPAFIRDYFAFMNSEAGKLNYWGTIKNFLLWCIERNDIRKDNISDITVSCRWESDGHQGAGPGRQ